MVFVCHDLLRPRDEGSCDFTGRSPSWYVTTLPNLVAIGIVVVKT